MEAIRKMVVNTDILNSILDCFGDITGIIGEFCSSDIEELIYCSKIECLFCHHIRKNSIIDKRCRVCDKVAFETVERKKGVHTYQCHLGFWEAIIPVFSDNVISGYFIFGHIKDIENVDGNWKKIESELAACGFEEMNIETARELYFNTGVKSGRKTVEASAKLLDLIANYMSDTKIIHIKGLDIVEKAKAYMGINYKKELSVKDIAKFSAVNKTYLCYIFKKVTGKTVTYYYNEIRIKEAEKFLQETSMSVKEICSEVGFNDQSYFSRLFKKVVGISPQQYRRQN